MASNTQLPEGWEEIKLGEIYKERKKSPLKVSDAANYGNFPFFTSGEDILKHNDFLIDDENIFLATGGVANVKYFNGKAAYSSDTYAIYLNGNNTKYIYYFVLDVLYYINNNYFLGSGLKHLQKKDFKNHQLCLPKSTAEQEKIAEVLGKVDEAIDLTEKLIKKYERIKTGLMQDLLTKGIDENGNIRSPTTHKFKPSPLGKIPVEWECEKLPTIATLSRGKFTPRPRNNPVYYGGEYPFIQTGDISNCKTLFLNEFTQTLNKKGAFVSKKFPKNTIVITIAANIGETAILGKVMYLTDSVVGIIAQQNAVYLELFLKTQKTYLENISTESAQKNINIEKLSGLFIKVPKIEEQTKISKYYLKIITQINLFNAKLKKHRSIKKGLMQDLLSGRVRVAELMKD